MFKTNTNGAPNLTYANPPNIYTIPDYDLKLKIYERFMSLRCPKLVLIYMLKSQPYEIPCPEEVLPTTFPVAVSVSMLVF